MKNFSFQQPIRTPLKIHSTPQPFSPLFFSRNRPCVNIIKEKHMKIIDQSPSTEDKKILISGFR